MAGVASDGCTGFENMTRGERLPRPPPGDDPTLDGWRCIGRPSPDTSLAGRLPVSIMKVGGRRGEKGARGSLAIVWN
jgi:hypothetical protein